MIDKPMYPSVDEPTGAIEIEIEDPESVSIATGGIEIELEPSLQGIGLHR